MENPKQVYVEIVERARAPNAADTVVKRMGPMSERSADRVERGANINLNHASFYTRQVNA